MKNSQENIPMTGNNEMKLSEEENGIKTSLETTDGFIQRETGGMDNDIKNPSPDRTDDAEKTLSDMIDVIAGAPEQESQSGVALQLDDITVDEDDGGTNEAPKKEDDDTVKSKEVNDSDVSSTSPKLNDDVTAGRPDQATPEHFPELPGSPGAKPRHEEANEDLINRERDGNRTVSNENPHDHIGNGATENKYADLPHATDKEKLSHADTIIQVDKTDEQPEESEPLLDQDLERGPGEAPRRAVGDTTEKFPTKKEEDASMLARFLIWLTSLYNSKKFLRGCSGIECVIITILLIVATLLLVKGQPPGPIPEPVTPGAPGVDVRDNVTTGPPSTTVKGLSLVTVKVGEAARVSLGLPDACTNTSGRVVNRNDVTILTATGSAHLKAADELFADKFVVKVDVNGVEILIINNVNRSDSGEYRQIFFCVENKIVRELGEIQVIP